jgi:hypothetical protein
MLKHLLESMLEDELDHHLEKAELGRINCKNGKRRRGLSWSKRIIFNFLKGNNGVIDIHKFSTFSDSVQ